MSKRWAYVIVFVIVTMVVWSGWEIYKAFEADKDVGEYRIYVSSIDPEINVDLINNVSKLQEKVLVKESEIAPQSEVDEYPK